MEKGDPPWQSSVPRGWGETLSSPDSIFRETSRLD
jgi:hypothetical protein